VRSGRTRSDRRETSALIELLTDGRGLRQIVAARLLAEEDAGEQLYAPALIDAEAAKVLRRLAGKDLDEDRATQAIDELADMALVRCTFAHLLPRIWELRYNMYPFDAVYVALAEDLGAPLGDHRREVRAAGAKRRHPLLCGHLDAVRLRRGAVCAIRNWWYNHTQ